jgi:hypothetical protein
LAAVKELGKIWQTDESVVATRMELAVNYFRGVGIRNSGLRFLLISQRRIRSSENCIVISRMI